MIIVIPTVLNLGRHVIMREEKESNARALSLFTVGRRKDDDDDDDDDGKKQIVPFRLIPLSLSLSLSLFLSSLMSPDDVLLKTM